MVAGVSNDHATPVFSRVSDQRRIAVGAAIAFVFGLICLAPAWEQNPVHVVVNALATAAFVATGLALPTDRDKRELSWALVSMGVLWSAQWLGVWNSGLLPVIAIQCNPILYIVTGYALLRYPRPLATRLPERVVIALLVGILPIGQMLLTIFSVPEWHQFSSSVWWPTVVADKTVFDSTINVLTVLWMLTAAGFAFAIRGRLRRMSGVDRMFAAPIALGFSAVVIITGLSTAIEPYPTSEVTTTQFVVSLITLLAPIGILFAIVKRRMHHSVVTQSLHRRFARDDLTVGGVQEALREALHDPTLEVVDWNVQSSARTSETGSSDHDQEPSIIETRRRFQPWWQLIAVALPTAAFATLCIFPAIDQTPLFALTNVLASCAYVLAGFIMIREQATRRLGWTLLVDGLLWAGMWFGTWNVGPSALICVSFNAFFYVLGGWGTLMYPRDLPLTRAERGVFWGMLLIPVSVAVPMTFSLPAWGGFDSFVWWPTIAPNRNLYDNAITVIYGVQGLLALGYALVMWTRLRRMRGIDQTITRPIVVGYCLVGLVSAMSQTTELHPSDHITTYYFVLSLVVLAVPSGILAAVFRRWVQHAAVARTMHADLANESPTVNGVRDALRRALHDESLDVLYWSPEVASHVDGKGNVTSLPNPGGRLVREIRNRDGEVLAAIIADPSLEHHAALMDTAVSASTIALENARLQASVRSQLQEVMQSRTRIAEAALEERKRLERDLHDGVQQRLLALMTRMGTLRNNTDDESTIDALGQFSNELRQTLEDLRSISRGIHPPELRQFGLREAIQIVAEGLPIDAEVDIPQIRWPEAVEAAAYYVICESLTNVVKHAKSPTAVVHVTAASHALVVTVTDHGVGGADCDTSGTGLSGLVDRIKTLGGELVINTKPSMGTTVKAIIPCALQ